MRVGWTGVPAQLWGGAGGGKMQPLLPALPPEELVVLLLRWGMRALPHRQAPGWGPGSQLCPPGCRTTAGWG